MLESMHDFLRSPATNFLAPEFPAESSSAIGSKVCKCGSNGDENQTVTAFEIFKCQYYIV
jgi:hypothetical protein